jgi:hypothetical protein
MNYRLKAIVIASLVAFASLVIIWQFRHYNDVLDPYPSVGQTFLRGKYFASISDVLKRQSAMTWGSEQAFGIDLWLSKDVRIFMPDMIGPTNYSKIGNYFWFTYYLFPREIGTSLDHITRLTKNGFVGTESESDQEILSNGYDVVLDVKNDDVLIRSLRDVPKVEPAKTDWFDSKTDLIIALLLPLLTALSGMRLFRFLFPTLGERMPLPEQLACGLGLGMMAVAALTLGVKLCGFHGRWLIFFVTAFGTIAEIWRDRKILLATTTDSFWNLVRSPITAVFVVIGILVFLILFRIAGVEGLVDGDAMRWMLKAKMIHLYTGNDLVKWFSNPALAHAHLDYPTLVPSLHSATYDSLGHVDEFVTKFWPVWMLLFLLGALASLTHAGKGRFHGPSFALLGLLLLPVIQMFAQWEGSTMPMIFFTVLGFVQCAIWLVEKDRARLGLGLTLLFGAAMVKFEGFIFLALAAGWMLLLPSARPSLKPSPRVWWMLAFCFLAVLPYVCLRIQIPVVNYESGWAGYAAHNPGTTLLNWPSIVMMQLARFFVNPDFANWSVEGGSFHWTGRWDGFSSLYNHTTLGLPWICLLTTAAFWIAVPTRRPIVIWTLAMFVGATVALSGVFASFIGIESKSEAFSLTGDTGGGRYLLPVLLAWFATIMTMFFAESEWPDKVHAPVTKAIAPKSNKRKRR